MKITTWALAFTLIIPSFAQAHMATPSIFPEIRSVNPATIPLRERRVMDANLEHRSIAQKQSVSGITSGGPDTQLEKNETTMDTFRFYTASKGGARTSAELSAELGSGSQDSKLGDDVTPNESYKTKITSQYLRAAFGRESGWGFDTHYAATDAKYTDNMAAQGGGTQESKSSRQVTGKGAKLGLLWGKRTLSFGATGEYNTYTVKQEGAHKNVGVEPSKNTVVGLAVGSASTKGNVELGVEADIHKPKSASDKDTLKGSPIKVSFIAERIVWGLNLGYKAMAYLGPYIEMDELIANELVYRNGAGGTRLQHVFNFGFAEAKGLALGLSGSYSSFSANQRSIYAADSSDSYKIEKTEWSIVGRVSYYF